MPAQIIQTMVFTQIMDIWRPGGSLEDHLKVNRTVIQTKPESRTYNHDNIVIKNRSIKTRYTVYSKRSAHLLPHFSVAPLGKGGQKFHLHNRPCEFLVPLP